MIVDNELCPLPGQLSRLTSGIEDWVRIRGETERACIPGALNAVPETNQMRDLIVDPLGLYLYAARRMSPAEN